MPEGLEIPMALCEDDPEAVGRRRRRPEMVAEHVTLGLERHHHHVVKRRNRPHQQDHADEPGAGIRQVTPAPRSAAQLIRRSRRRGGDRPGICRYRGHSCTSAVLSLRIRMITSGISSGNADITAATPSWGLPSSSMSRTTPSVASRCVELAGPPPVTKYTELKSPSRKIVASNVNTRYKLASSGKVTCRNLRNPVAPSTLAAS